MEHLAVFRRRSNRRPSRRPLATDGSIHVVGECAPNQAARYSTSNPFAPFGALVCHCRRSWFIGVHGNDREPERSKVAVEREHVFDIVGAGEHAGRVIDKGDLVVVVPLERAAGVRECRGIGMEHRHVR